MNPLEIRRLRLEDAPAANAVLAAAFHAFNPNGVVEREVELAPETSWCAVVNDRPAGLVCAIEYGHTAYIGPMAVHPELQGRGIGNALMTRLIASLEQRGCQTMLLDATDAGEGLYRKFGFAGDGSTHDFRRDPAGNGISIRADGLDEALRLDRPAFGEDRSSMFRWLIEQDKAAVLNMPGQGYLLSQPKVLGPILASNASVAGSLVEQALAAGAAATRVLAPVENPNAASLFKRLGYRVDREVLHMRRGARSKIRRDLYYGLASFALG